MIAARQAQAAKRALSSRGLASQLLAKPKEEWTYNELRREARERGVVQSGTKANLLARLLADDVSRANQFSTSATSSAPPKKTPAPKVVAPEDTPVNANPVSTPARAAFKSSRTVKPAASDAPQIPGIPTSDNPFAPKRSTPLYVAIPQEIDPPEEGPVIPVVPEKYGSSPHESASPPQAVAPADTPRVHSVSGLDEHLAAPAHPTSTTAVNPQVQATSSPSEPSKPSTGSSWADTFNAARKSLGETLQSGHWADDATRQNSSHFTKDEKKGIYVLAGILGGGWLLGGLLAPSSGKEKSEGH